LNAGNPRTVLIRKNILASFLIRGLSIAVSLILVPVTLNYLNETRYGIWITLTSLIAWIGIFDLGLGNGLRNKLATSLAIQDFNQAKKYVSTAYFSLFVIGVLITSIFFSVHTYIDWSIVLNTDSSYATELNRLVLLVFVFFILRFVFNLISVILTAYQYPMYSSLIDLLGNSLALLGIYLLTLSSDTSLLSFGLVALSAPLIIYLIATIICFNFWLKDIKPSFQFFELKMVKDIFGLGLQFFLIQVAVLVIFQTSNILISQFFEPKEVTPYNIAFRYFSVLTMVFGIIMAPMWSSFTDAYTQHDFGWIKKKITQLNYLVGIAVVLVIVLSLSANFLIGIWTQGKINLSQSMIVIFALFTIISLWNNIYSFFLNGISKTRVQIITSAVAVFTHIPLSYILTHYCGFGSEGIALSMAICLGIFAVFGPIHTYKILNSWKKT
jgi:O-antigen/teichoic acid export membrane protein